MNETKRKCPDCLLTKPFIDFAKDKQQAHGLKPYCRECGNKRTNAYYQANKSKRLLRTKDYYQTIKDSPEFKIKSRARAKVKVAVLKGIIKKENCVYCEGNKVQAHHPNGYDNGNALKIQWLCRTHHELAHHPSPYGNLINQTLT